METVSDDTPFNATGRRLEARCPMCGSEDTRPSRTRREDGLGLSLFRSPVRCRKCKGRFWRPARQGAGLIAAIAVAVVVVIGAIGIGITALQSASTDANGGTPVASADFRGNHTIELPARVRVDPDLVEQAAKGDARAQFQRGIAFLEGRGELQDFAEAGKWLRSAAEQGHAMAQYTLGLMYRTGQGVAIDFEKSYMWFNLAVANGVGEAVPLRDGVMRSLSPEQAARAQAAARTFLAAQQRATAKTE